MTTKVTIDAHAGWPVRVTRISGGGRGDETVAANTIQEFHVHDEMDLRIHEVQPNDGPTIGDKMVGRTFNPSADKRVDHLKALFAEVIDVMTQMRWDARGDGAKPSIETVRLASVAITEAQTAQMWAVKAATWKD